MTTRTLACTCLMALLLVLPFTGFPGRAAADCAERDPAGMLPAGDCAGWARTGEPITASTVEELAALIDGSAYFYAAYGFVAAAFVNFAGEIAGEPAEITVSLFNQGSEENALTLYQDEGSGTGEPVADWPGSGAARLQAGLGTVTFQFHEACFFASLATTAGGEAGVAPARCLAEAILARIQAATPERVESWAAIKQLFE